MFSSTILTSWAACPQSRLYEDVVAAGEPRAVKLLTKVARQWDHTLAPAWVTRLVPRRLRPAPFDPDRYAAVVAVLPVDALGATMDHVDWLRSQPCVRASLRSVAFLEAFEAVVARELDARAERSAGWAELFWTGGRRSGRRQTQARSTDERCAPAAGRR